MRHFLKTFFRCLGRVFPGCITLSQAIAFNMFLSFFPILLLALGVLSSTSLFHDALREIPERLSFILPPGTSDVVFAYFVRRGVHPWRWMSLGLGATLVAGSQVMVGFIEAFGRIEGDELRQGYWRIHFRALLLLCLTILPMLAVVYLTVFGKQGRAWLIRHLGAPALIHQLGFLFYTAAVFLLAMAVLVAIYWIGRPGHRGYRNLLPGAVLSTILWWATDIFFGLYVRRMPYNVVYGGLAAAIGLLLWLYLTALIVLVGAAYNAEEAAVVLVSSRAVRTG
jgi:membrane protein